MAAGAGVREAESGERDVDPDDGELIAHLDPGRRELIAEHEARRAAEGRLSFGAWGQKARWGDAEESDIERRPEIPSVTRPAASPDNTVMRSATRAITTPTIAASLKSPAEKTHGYSVTTRRATTGTRSQAPNAAESPG